MVRARYVGPGRIWVLRLGSWLVYDAECFVSVQDDDRMRRRQARQAARDAAIAAVAVAHS
jgi:hypothetical protein